jgi:hypothetical protein
MEPIHREMIGKEEMVDLQTLEEIMTLQTGHLTDQKDRQEEMALMSPHHAEIGMKTDNRILIAQPGTDAEKSGVYVHRAIQRIPLRLLPLLPLLHPAIDLVAPDEADLGNLVLSRTIHRTEAILLQGMKEAQPVEWVSS